MKNLIPLLRPAPVACAMGIAMLVMTNPALAQDAPPPTQESDWNVVAGLGVLRTPIFPGASKSEVRPAPYLSIDYDDRFSCAAPRPE